MKKVREDKVLKISKLIVGLLDNVVKDGVVRSLDDVEKDFYSAVNCPVTYSNNRSHLEKRYS